MADPNLVTTCTFHGQEYLFKMNILCNSLEILVTDKNSGEEWQCSYDATYIENLTHKTGNFKQFEIFVAMIKSGLLRTSESVSLDLLTFEDLEMIRSRKITKSIAPDTNNRRYLIVTYVVEFDKIRYPLPLEYCGPPDPVILQATIRRLEVELSKTKEELAAKCNNNEARKIYYLQKRIDELSEENLELQEEIRHLSKLVGKKPKAQVLSLQKAVSNLEKCVVSERNSHHELVEKLKNEKHHLAKELEKVKCSEKCLKSHLNRVSRMGIGDHPTQASNKASSHSLRTMYKRTPSPEFEDCREIKHRSKHRIENSKSKHQWGEPRLSKSLTKHNTSRESSTSSNKYADADVLDYQDCNIRSRTTTPSRSKMRPRSRCSSQNSRASSRGSSTASKSGKTRKSQVDYNKLEQKIAHLEKMLEMKCNI